MPKEEDKAKSNPDQSSQASSGEFGVDEIIKSVLIKAKYFTAEDLNKAEAYAKAHNISLVDHILSLNIISKEGLGQTIAWSFGLRYADLDRYQPTKEQISLIPADVGQQYRAVVYAVNEKAVVIATDNPKQANLMEKMRELFPNRAIMVAYGLNDDIESLLVNYRKPLATRFNQIIQEQHRVAPEIIDEIIRDAIAYKVSDIHFEPEETIVVIRFRVDGVLHEAGRVPKQYYDNILNRFKVLSHMRIDEHNASQDGAIRYKVDDEPLDIRISIVPTLDGEKIALRLLAEYSRNLNYKNLGLSESDLKIITDQAKRPFGMIVTSGPTGSGKTTTLYALLKLVNRPEINITTIEDPVEYKISGINQIQVNPQTNLTFAQGLRSTVRQDPDVILVGEIRDEETAKLGVNAALTGHLLFSTFHANDAATSIPRLIDMGVEPFLLASTLNVVISQRLVRGIHKACRERLSITYNDIKLKYPFAAQYFKPEEINLYHGKGCEGCNFTGYKGRLAIFELITITPEMKELMLKNPSVTQVWALAKQQGAHSLFEDGVDKIKAGKTTLEELYRVAEPK